MAMIARLGANNAPSARGGATPGGKGIAGLGVELLRLPLHRRRMLSFLLGDAFLEGLYAIGRALEEERGGDAKPRYRIDESGVGKIAYYTYIARVRILERRKPVVGFILSDLARKGTLGTITIDGEITVNPDWTYFNIPIIQVLNSIDSDSAAKIGLDGPEPELVLANKYVLDEEMRTTAMEHLAWYLGETVENAGGAVETPGNETSITLTEYTSIIRVEGYRLPDKVLNGLGRLLLEYVVRGPE